MTCSELENFEEAYLKLFEQLEELYLRLLLLPHKYPERRGEGSPPFYKKLVKEILEKRNLALVSKTYLDRLLAELKNCRREISPRAYILTMLYNIASSRIFYQLMKDPKPFVNACELFEKSSQATYVNLVKMLALISPFKWFAFTVPLKYCYLPPMDLEKYNIRMLGPGKYLNLFDIKGKFLIEL